VNETALSGYTRTERARSAQLGSFRYLAAVPVAAVVASVAAVNGRRERRGKCLSPGAFDKRQAAVVSGALTGGGDSLD